MVLGWQNARKGLWVWWHNLNKLEMHVNLDDHLELCKLLKFPKWSNSFNESLLYRYQLRLIYTCGSESRFALHIWESEIWLNNKTRHLRIRNMTKQQNKTLHIWESEIWLNNKTRHLRIRNMTKQQNKT